MTPDAALELLLRDPDPYTLTYRALWAMLERSDRFSAVVRPGNRIKLDGVDRAPFKEDISEADLPEVRIVEIDSTPQLYRASNCDTDTVKYEIQVSTGDQRLTRLLYPLKWIIFCAMADATDYLRQAVVWHGTNPVVSALPVSVASGVSTLDLNRGLKGWSGVWAVQVQFAFASNLIRS